ncbi:acyl-CoA thioesterase [Ahrensia marina]|uniref:Acyl-CoA thioesterase n=2 Tax=Ahrensia marina TaxID=1514904 RepID=A0A0N0E6L1_9HYPH|nr:acyl-CoA thioesterase [Ahrensia marina]
MFKSLSRSFSLYGLIVMFAVSSVNAQTLQGVGFGDSLMAGYQLENGNGFPDQLQAALKEKGYDVAIANAGVSGDTTSGGLSRLEWSVPDTTDFVILELGGNDALRGIKPEITRQNLDEMITALKTRDIDVLLAGMVAPPNMGDAYGEAFNKIYADLSEKHDVPLYPFFLEGAITNPELMQDDGIHPTKEGVEVMVENFLPFLETYLTAQKTE